MLPIFFNKIQHAESSRTVQSHHGRWVMSPGGQSNLLLTRRLLHPSTHDFDPIRARFFAQVLPNFPGLFAPERDGIDTGDEALLLRGFERSPDPFHPFLTFITKCDPNDAFKLQAAEGVHSI